VTNDRDFLGLGFFTSPHDDGPMGRFSPFARLGSMVNVVICAILIVSRIILLASGQPGELQPLVFAIVLEVVFVAILVRAFRAHAQDS
jgi:hypothetical protein